MNKRDNINILVVDDKAENLLVMESLLDSMNCNIIKATSGNEALSLMLDYDFALVLLDVQMPEMDGFETAELMRSIERTRYIPIIFVTAISKEQKCIFRGYELGAVDYLFKPIESGILKSKIKVFIELHNQRKIVEEQASLLELKVKELMELQAVNSTLESLSMLDGLTGISNRRSFNEYIEKSWKNSIRSGKSISLIMADIDYFKAYNDNYGHQQGDECLIKVAKTIASSLKRPLDFAARYGGEEFAIILPETESNGALIVAEELRQNIESLMLRHEHSKVSPFATISLGVSSMIPKSTNMLSDFINETDKALYVAKSSGRNRVSADVVS